MRFFDSPLETNALIWRLERRDGFTIGLTSHDQDLWIDGVRYRAAPGLMPSAIMLGSDTRPDTLDLDGALASNAIRADDLAQGLWDGAHICISMIDWSAPDQPGLMLFIGTLAEVTAAEGQFSAEVQSIKTQLGRPYLPQTSPSCRARFCGPGCNLSAARFSSEAVVAEVQGLAIAFATLPRPLDAYVFGQMRWSDGANAGLTADIVGVTQDQVALQLDSPMPYPILPGDRAQLIEGCDHEFATCKDRFANGHNFRGEPHLPGHDLLMRYPGGQG